MIHVMTKNKQNRGFAVLAVVLALVLISGYVALYFLAVSIYDGSFNYRCTTSEDIWLEVSQFEGMSRERQTFTSNKGQKLVGYLYEHENVEEKGVIVFAHGMGAGGQTAYMDMFAYLTEQGYYVFAYDATGNDESEGEVIGGLPQGFIDLDHAIDYAYTIDKISQLPFVLMGYSWGGMSVVNALNYHPEVEAVVSIAGWNESMNLIDYRGCQMVGGVAKLLLPFASLYEYFMYGDYSFSTGMDGFAASDCDVFIIHGEQDDTIPIQYGYGTYYEKYASDPRFTFKVYEDRDHSLLNLEDGTRDMDMMAEVAAFFDRCLAD
jgi:pimeloyl-ACP methyl ester carboxylesterase